LMRFPSCLFFLFFFEVFDFFSFCCFFLIFGTSFLVYRVKTIQTKPHLLNSEKNFSFESRFPSPGRKGKKRTRGPQAENDREKDKRRGGGRRREKGEGEKERGEKRRRGKGEGREKRERRKKHRREGKVASERYLDSGYRYDLRKADSLSFDRQLYTWHYCIGTDSDPDLARFWNPLSGQSAGATRRSMKNHCVSFSD